MGTFLSTVMSLMFVYGGTAGVELVMARYATPEARAEAQARMPVTGRLDGTYVPSEDDAARP